MNPVEAAGRTGSMAMALPALGALATLFMDVGHNRTLGEELMRHTEPLVIFGPIFLLCAFIAVRSWLPKPPGRLSNRVLAIATFVIMTGMTMFWALWCMKRGRRYDDEIAFWLSAPWPLFAGIAWGRGGQLGSPDPGMGWARWGHRVAALGFIMLPLGGIMINEASRDTPPTAFFAAMACITFGLPVSLFITWPRRVMPDRPEPKPAKPEPETFDDLFDESSA